jgi:SNF2 family DNA or RNA helicase
VRQVPLPDHPGLVYDPTAKRLVRVDEEAAWARHVVQNSRGAIFGERWLYAASRHLVRADLGGNVRLTSGTGGVCCAAHQMASGKTLMVLDVILHDKPPEIKREDVEAARAAGAPRPVNSTLVVVPRQLLSQWQRMCEDQLTQGFLPVYVYPGIEGVASQAQVSEEVRRFARHRLVLTTYRTLISEEPITEERRSFGTRSGRDSRGVPSPLVAVQWRRIVIDEAQTVGDRPVDGEAPRE